MADMGAVHRVVHLRQQAPAAVQAGRGKLRQGGQAGDLEGRDVVVIPAVAEVRAYLADFDEKKRDVLIETLLQKPAHATRLANQWRDALLPRNDAIAART